MSKCISTAQARTKSAPRGSQALGRRHVHCILRKRAFADIRLNSSLRGPCVILHRLTRDPGEILPKRSLHEELAAALS